MFNLERERQFIIDAGQMLCGDDFIYSDDFEYIAESWELSKELQKFVGPTGVREFPMIFDNNVVLEDGKNLSSAIRCADYALGELFYFYSQAEDYFENIEESAEKKFLIEGLRRKGCVAGANINYKVNKVVLDLREGAHLVNIHGEKLSFPVRKSVLKTVEKIAMDIFTKEYYNIVVSSSKYQENLQEFKDALDILSNIVSKNVQSKGTLYLSALPQDLLTMSINRYNWGSCFDATGCNSHMPYEHVRNMNTMVAYYIPDSAKNKTFKYAGLDVSNKSWRVLVHMTAKGNLAIGETQYPTTSKDLGQNLAAILASAYDGEIVENKRIWRDGCQYFDNTNIYININNKGEDIKKLTSEDHITDDKSVCVLTGEYIGEQNSDIKTFRSVDQLDLEWCEDCEEYHGGDSYEVQNMWGAYHVCEYCFENYNYCEYSDIYYYESDNEQGFVLEPYGVKRFFEGYFDNLVDEGYRHLHINVIGISWEQKVQRAYEFLLSDEIETLTNDDIKELIQEMAYSLKPQVFHIFDEKDTNWNLLTQTEFGYENDGSLEYAVSLKEMSEIYNQ